MTHVVSRLVSPMFSDALHFASELHAEQSRKGSTIPYISHLMAVSALALENGGDEELAIAALLHDAIEDQPIDQQAIADRFGDRVADIVTATGEADKDAAWKKRKQDYITHLENARADAVFVSLCDKVHNAGAMASDFAEQGDAFWNHFNAGRDDQAWYYSSLIEVFRRRNANPRLLAALATSMGRLGF